MRADDFFAKKSKRSFSLLRRGAGGGTHIATQSALLDDPKASHFGTRLRSTRLKTIINRFINASCPLRVQVPLIQIPNKKPHTLWVYGLLFGAGGGT